MAEKPISDKALIRKYLTKKGWNKHAFSVALGFGRSFLDPDSTLSVENLRKITEHPEFNDLNVLALLDRDEAHILKSKGQLSPEIANQTFIIEAVAKMTELKTAPEKINREETLKLIDYLNRSIHHLSELSEAYTTLFKEYQQLKEVISNESLS